MFLHVLVAAGDPILSMNVGDYLQGRGHAVDFAADGHAVLRLARETAYDAMLLDASLPGIDGLELCSRLGESPGRPAILLVSPDGSESTVLAGFDAGADDCLALPLSLPALQARLQALARRVRSADALHVGDLRFNPSTLKAWRGERAIDLRPSALRLLHRLLLASPGVISRETAVRTIWGDSPPDGDGALRAHIHTLRTALEAEGESRLLHTVPRIGFRIADDEDE